MHSKAMLTNVLVTLHNRNIIMTIEILLIECSFAIHVALYIYNTYNTNLH